MSRTINIADRLMNADKFIHVAENKTYKVDDRKNTVLQINELLDDGAKPEIIDKVIEMTLGKDAYKEIEDMGLSWDGYQALFIAIMAAIQNKDFEEVEKTFRSASA